MSEWIECSERLPSLEGKEGYSCNEIVIAFTASGLVKPLYYSRQMYNRTEKGREPRWEDMRGRIASPPIAWQPLPAPPTK